MEEHACIGLCQYPAGDAFQQSFLVWKYAAADAAAVCDGGLRAADERRGAALVLSSRRP